ncbi:MAG: transglycosylase SLT domain-containing protein [Solirubrobacteraceae bacterium]|nr:transglycosylase SLT domain-containing protein [Solirubrobacteraceae bacterium]
MPASLRRTAFALLAVAFAFVALLAVASQLSDDEPPKLTPGSGVATGESDDEVDPLAWDAGREGELVAAAQRGFAHPLYTLVPGGALATAARVARYRQMVDAFADEGGIDADDLEALVYVESAGRPAAAADPRYVGATGLTQIVAETGENLLDMQVDPAGARSLTRRIRRAARRGDAEGVRTLEARRRVVDQRFDPPRALQGAVKYLEFARKELGRDDLAMASYHAGVGNIQNVLKAYDGGDDVSYAQVYFDTSPVHNAEAYRKLAALGDDSATYLWRIGAAKRIMRLYRHDRAELRRQARLQTAKNSAEEVLWPQGSTRQFRSARQLRAAYEDDTLRRLPSTLLLDEGVRIDPQMGELAPQMHLSRRLYRGLKPEALAVLVTLGAGVQEIGKRGPIRVTSTVRDLPYQQMLIGVNGQATREYSLHTTGYAFDILRRFRSEKQEAAFWFMLTRLQALDMIAWLPEFGAIHVTTGKRAKALIPVLDAETERVADD